MSFFQRNKPQTLSEWLDVATRRLAAPVRERIRAEIEAHYAESVREQRANGLSQSAAEAEALAELGDAGTAAKRFRKGHLTEWEAQRLEGAIKAGRSIWVLGLQYFLFAFYIREWLRHEHWPKDLRDPFLCFALQFMVLVVLPTASFVLARFGGSAPRRSLLLLIQPASGPLMSMTVMMLFMFSSWWPGLIISVGAYTFRWPFLLWKKVLAAEHSVPPQDPAQT
jgi:hypothetical protein